jgi:hypothetical protein
MTTINEVDTLPRHPEPSAPLDLEPEAFRAIGTSSSIGSPICWQASLTGPSHRIPHPPLYEPRWAFSHCQRRVPIQQT